MREQDEHPMLRSPAFELKAAPVPARDVVLVSMTAGSAGWARVGVYDLSGREVRLLHDGTLASGRHELAWDGQDPAGRRVPDGVYFLQARNRESLLTRKLILRR